MKRIPNEFIEVNSLEKRKNTATMMLEKHPNKIPVIIVLSPDIRKKNTYLKYLISNDLSSSYVMTLVRRNINMSSEKAIFLLSENGTLLVGTNEMINIYNSHKNEDGYLYISVYLENTFGS